MTGTLAPSDTRLHRALWLSPARIGLVALAWVAAVVLHNLVYGLLRGFFAEGWDEPVFFLLAVVVIPIYFIAAAVYTLVTLVRARLR